MPNLRCETELIPEIGAIEAIFVDHIDYWAHNGKEKYRDAEGKMWFFATINNFAETTFPGTNKRKIERVISKLECLDILLSERPNGNGRKKYRLNYDHELISRYYSDPDEATQPTGAGTTNSTEPAKSGGTDITEAGSSKTTNPRNRPTKTGVADQPESAAPIYKLEKRKINKKKKRGSSFFPALSEEQAKIKFGKNFMDSVRECIDQSVEAEEEKIRSEISNIPLARNLPSDVAGKAAELSEEEFQYLWEDSVHLCAKQLPEYSRGYAVGILKNKLRAELQDPTALDCTKKETQQ